MMSKSDTEEEAISNPKKKDIYYKYMNSSQTPMAGYFLTDGNYVKGIEDYLSDEQYQRVEHQKMVVKDIIENWVRLSYNGKFHAILATHSIREAIDYYRIIKELRPELKVTSLFDPNIDNQGNVEHKTKGLEEIITDYNKLYEQDFKLATHGKFKKDISARLAHKKPYQLIERTPDKQIDLLIVVDQMLTGFDSKWLNTLYLDKKRTYENIIQAFSRTNRLFGNDKPFGTIRYYRFPHTMEQNIDKAVKLYSGDKPLGLFVERLEGNLNRLNLIFEDIAELFINSDVQNFEKLPEDTPACAEFARLFKVLNSFLEASKIQGFSWDKSEFVFGHGKGNPKTKVELKFDENTYLILALRYKELFSGESGGGGESVPFEIDGYLTEIDTGLIDADYMNSRFDKYLKELNKDVVNRETIQATLNELHKSFATLSQEEQKYANIFLHDVQSGTVKLKTGKTFRDYITEYQYNAKDEQINFIVTTFGLDETKLRDMIDAGLTEKNINEYGRFDALKDSVDKTKAREFFEDQKNRKISTFKVNSKVYNLLVKFIVEGKIDF